MHSFTSTPDQALKDFVKQRHLTQEERSIIARLGMLPIVAKVLLAKSGEVLSSIRGNDSGTGEVNTRRLSMPSFPKKGEIQTKSCIVKPAVGFVAMDNRYTTKAAVKAGDMPSNQLTMAAPLMLQEIIANLNNGTYQRVEGAPPGCLRFKVNPEQEGAPVPEAVKGDIFQIQIRESGRFTPPMMVEEDEPAQEPEDILDKPDWWDEELYGNYLLHGDLIYSLQYQPKEEKEFKDFQVAAELLDGRLVPVVPDHDQWGQGVSRQFMNDLIHRRPEMNELINAMPGKSDKIEHLIEQRRKLEIEIFEQQNKCIFQPEINPEHLKIAKEMDTRLRRGDLIKGNITPIESYFNDSANSAIRSYLPNVGNLMPHGADLHTPYNLSKLGTVVFFINNQIQEVKGPEKLAKFICDSVLPQFTFDIHHQCPMKYFAPVVEKQIELSKTDPMHRVFPKVMEAYRVYQALARDHDVTIVTAPSSGYNKAAHQSAEKEPLAEVPGQEQQQNRKNSI